MDSKHDFTIDVSKVMPSRVAQKCPVCSGFGKVNWQKQICHGCEGKGYILVPAEEVRE